MVTVLIRSCVSMLGVPVDPDTLHATLRLCLRLTRDHKYAMMFAELKSTRMILSLTQSSGFNGFTPLVTLLFRHIIEDPCTLQHTMEKVNVYKSCIFSLRQFSLFKIQCRCNNCRRILRFCGEVFFFLFCFLLGKKPPQLICSFK